MVTYSGQRYSPTFEAAHPREVALTPAELDWFAAYATEEVVGREARGRLLAAWAWIRREGREPEPEPVTVPLPTETLWALDRALTATNPFRDKLTDGELVVTLARKVWEHLADPAEVRNFARRDALDRAEQEEIDADRAH